MGNAYKKFRFRTQGCQRNAGHLRSKYGLGLADRPARNHHGQSHECDNQYNRSGDYPLGRRPLGRGSRRPLTLAFPLEYLSGRDVQDLSGPHLVVFVDQQVVGQIVGRPPEAWTAAQGTDDAGYVLQLKALFRHPGRGLIVEDRQTDLFSASITGHSPIIGVGFPRCPRQWIGGVPRLDYGCPHA